MTSLEEFIETRDCPAVRLPPDCARPPNFSDGSCGDAVGVVAPPAARRMRPDRAGDARRGSSYPAPVTPDDDDEPEFKSAALKRERDAAARCGTSCPRSQGAQGVRRR